MANLDNQHRSAAIESVHDSIDRETQRKRPQDQKLAGYQDWSSLLFVHWRIPESILRPLIPAQLEIDCFDGSAWLGLVPFYMSGVRPAWAPALPWISNFCETNLRTYVCYRGQPGVWFFSLEASRWLPVKIARMKWSLNYYWAKMKLEREGNQVQYQSSRFGNVPQAETEIVANLGETIAGEALALERGSLEDFLAERYLLYTVNSHNELLCGQVHHRPYPLRQAKLERFHQTITLAAGLEVGEPDHVLFSEGVSTEIYPLTPVSKIEP